MTSAITPCAASSCCMYALCVTTAFCLCSVASCCRSFRYSCHMVDRTPAAASPREIVHQAHGSESFRARNGMGSRMGLGPADARAEICVNERYGRRKCRKALEGMRVVQAVHVDDVGLPRPERGHCGIRPAGRGTEHRHITDVDASTIRTARRLSWKNDTSSPPRAARE